MKINEADKKLINELGLQGVPEEQQVLGLQQFASALHLRVGMALEDTLSDEQFAEFEKVSTAGDDQATGEWLKQAVPNLDSIVAKEQAALVQEIRQSNADIRKIIEEPAA